MVNILTGMAINSDVPEDRTPPISLRLVLATLFKQTAAGVPVEGIIPAPGTAPLSITGSASAMQYTVSPGWAITTRTAKGAYIVGTVAAVVVPTAAAHATLPRIDRLYIVQPDPELSESGHARIDVVNGTPASTPVAPALPTGALELGRKVVAAGATNTSSGAAITNRPDLTGLNLGTITAAMITDQMNIDAGKINGVKITTNNTGIAPPTPAVGDVWVDYS